MSAPRDDPRTSAPSPLTAPSFSSSRPYLHLLAGGIAGLSVDLVLFPLDTIKTRMQSRGGLTQSGGFGKLFSGVASAAAGSGQ
jgi:solute carrier family 25 S-adenosylmethionine transporter 26